MQKGNPFFGYSQVAPVLFVALLGLIGFGRALYNYYQQYLSGENLYFQGQLISIGACIVLSTLLIGYCIYRLVNGK